MPFHQQRLNPDRNEKKTERVNAGGMKKTKINVDRRQDLA